jgi:hypothetical protein
MGTGQYFSEAGDHLANERTFLAWIRVGGSAPRPAIPREKFWTRLGDQFKLAILPARAELLRRNRPQVLTLIYRDDHSVGVTSGRQVSSPLTAVALSADLTAPCDRLRP